jgi:hypothetical protein
MKALKYSLLFLLTANLFSISPLHAQQTESTWRRAVIAGAAGNSLCVGILAMASGAFIKLSHPSYFQQQLEKAKLAGDIAQVESHARTLGEAETAHKIGKQLLGVGASLAGLGGVGLVWTFRRSVPAFRQTETLE